MPLIREIWGEGHPNAGATLNFVCFGKDDDANHYTLRGSAMGYSTIMMRADDIEVLAKDAFPWLKKYGVLTYDTEEELIEEWKGLKHD
jgi:hypothetical protein